MTSIENFKGGGWSWRRIWAWLLFDDLPAAWGVEAVLLLLQVEVPVVVEVATEVEGAQLDHGLGPWQAPPHPGAFQSVFDQVLAGPFHTAAGDGQAPPQVL